MLAVTLPATEILATLTDALARIYEVDLPRVPDEPTFFDYYGGKWSSAQVEEFIRYRVDLLEFGRFDPLDKTVLEAGCGKGLNLVFLAALGSSEVHGIDIVPWNVATIDAYKKALPHDLSSRISVREGDVARLPYADDSFDLVLSNEAISHYREVPQFLDEAYRVLSPGGTLLIADGNNALNARIRRANRAVWASHEEDPAKALASGVQVDEGPHEFVRRRRQMITKEFPHLSDEVAHELALRTSGMAREEILRAVYDYVETQRLPADPYQPGQVTIHPEYGMAMERLFNPYKLGREITSRGFRVRVRGYWGGAAGKRTIRLANRILATVSPLAMFTARSFRIAAVKT